jgi:hypothetical protein
VRLPAQLPAQMFALPELPQLEPESPEGCWLERCLPEQCWRERCLLVRQAPLRGRRRVSQPELRSAFVLELPAAGWAALERFAASRREQARVVVPAAGSRPVAEFVAPELPTGRAEAPVAPKSARRPTSPLPALRYTAAMRTGGRGDFHDGGSWVVRRVL